jgi:hypothetical protein
VTGGIVGCALVRRLGSSRCRRSRALDEGRVNGRLRSTRGPRQREHHRLRSWSNMRLLPCGLGSRLRIGFSHIDICPEDLDNLASATSVHKDLVPFLSRKRALAALREVASLRPLLFAAPALATLRRLKSARNRRPLEGL